MIPDIDTIWDTINHETPDQMKARIRAEKRQQAEDAKGEHQAKLDAQGGTIAEAMKRG